MTTGSDFHGQDLRGRSFDGENLDGADFRETDLRGVDFSSASLVEANFTDARLGVTTSTAVLILIGALVIALASGVAVGFIAESTRQRATSSDWRDVLAAILIGGAAILFFVVALLKGVSMAFRVFVVMVIVIVIVDFGVVFVIAGEIRYRNAVPVIWLLVMVVPVLIAGMLGRMVGGSFGAWTIGIISVFAGLAAGRAHGGVAAVAVSVILVFLSKRTLLGDARDGPLRYIGHRIASYGGTRFTGADLTRADFTRTAPIHSEMASAILDEATWEPGKAPYIHEA
jgi:hypothetical protein